MMRNWRAFAAMASALMLLVPLVAVADVNGDGRADLGVFGVEASGLARGGWIQVVDGVTKTLIADKIIGNEGTGHRFAVADTSNSGSDEIIELHRRVSDDATRLMIRSQSGALLAQLVVAGSDHTALDLVPIQANLDTPIEVAVLHRRETDGIIFVDVLKRDSATTITRLYRTALFGSGFANPKLLVGDMIDDGRDEAIVCADRLSDSFLLCKILNSQTGSNIAFQAVSSGAISSRQLRIGNLVPTGAEGWTAGVELLVGGIRDADDRAIMLAFDEDLTRRRIKVIGPDTFHGYDFQVIDIGALDGVLLGSVRTSTNIPFFTLWNGDTLTKIAQRLMGGTDAQVVRWFGANVDGSVDGSDEVVLGFVSPAGTIAFHVADRTFGDPLLAQQAALSSDHTDPQFNALDAIQDGRDSIYVGGNATGGKIALRLFQGTAGGVLEMALNTMTDDVI